MRYQYALPLSVQYDNRVPSASESRGAAGTPDAARSSRPQRAKQLARTVARDDGELGPESGGHLVDIAVPTDAQAISGLLLARGNPDDLFVERVERGEQHGAAVGRDEAERKHDRGPDRE